MTESESDGGVGVWGKSHGRSMRTCVADNKRNGESWYGDGVEQDVRPLINRAWSNTGKLDRESLGNISELVRHKEGRDL